MDEDTKNFFRSLSRSEEPVATPAKNLEVAESNVDTSSEASIDSEPSASEDVGGEGQLTVDVYHTPSEIIIESPIAGVIPEDLDIAITTDSVTIRGKRNREQSIKDQDYLYQECYWGAFSRSVVLPQEISADKAQATMKNGVLVIRLPKANLQRTRKVKVQFS